MRNSNVSTPAGAAETEYSDVTGDVQLLSPEDSDEEETEVTRSSSVAETNQDEAGSYFHNIFLQAVQIGQFSQTKSSPNDNCWRN